MVDEIDIHSWPDRRADSPAVSPVDRRAGRDRRSHLRLRLTFEIALPVRLRTAEGIGRGLARNVSEGGMLIEVIERPPIGSELDITIAGVLGSLDSPEALTLLGEVRHHFSWQYRSGQGQEIMRAIGVRFLEKSRFEAEASKAWSRLSGTTMH
jgi:hypothetical protein